MTYLLIFLGLLLPLGAAFAFGFEAGRIKGAEQERRFLKEVPPVPPVEEDPADYWKKDPADEQAP